MVDDCPECKEIALLRNKVDNLAQWLDEAQRDNSIKSFFLMRIVKILESSEGLKNEQLSELLGEIKQSVRL
jgi:hypothetical protein